MECVSEYDGNEETFRHCVRDVLRKPYSDLIRHDPLYISGRLPWAFWL